MPEALEEMGAEALMRRSRIALKQALLLFAIPACWLALLGIALLVGLTPWGARGGHPPNWLGLFLLSLMAAPIFGLAGCTYAMMRKAHFSPRIVKAAMATSMCLLV